jgi:hypothetical protein
MPTVTFKKEAQTYEDALNAYNRQLKGHNNLVSKYNESFFTDAKGNKYVREQPYQALVPSMDPFTGEWSTDMQNLGGGYFSINSSGKLKEVSKPSGNYQLTSAGNGFEVLRTPLNPGEDYPDKPGQWTQKFNMQKPDLTVDQKKRLDQPNLSDIERLNESSGLINSAFNY